MSDDDELEDPGLQGRVIWPIREGQAVPYNDAYATLFDLCDCKIQISSYHENGNDRTGNLEIHLSGWELYEGSLPTYFAMPLKEALEEELEKLIDDDNSDEEIASWPNDDHWPATKERILKDRPMVRRSRRLAELLLEAYAVWEKEGE